MVLADIESYLSKKIGLDPNTIGSRKLQRAITKRCQACGVADMEAYWKLLQRSAEEFTELVEQIVIPETWFFRDRQPFEFLKAHVQSNHLHRADHPPLKILSVPCSTGEEPYSIAIILLEAGLSVKQFAIDAIDISHHAIVKARRAIYTKNSFRGPEVIDRNRYFRQIPEGQELVPWVQSAVTFKQGNLLNLVSLLQHRYDIIFCRNLLIYLEDRACTQAMTLFDRLLAPGGLLFVGASETSKVPGDRFASVRKPFTFAYSKARASSPITSSNAISIPPAPIPSPAQRKLTSIPAPPVSSPQPLAPRSQPLSTFSRPTQAITPTPQLDLEVVRNLADQGKLEDAVALCHRYLEADRTHPEAYILLGELY
ncbi:MAG: protein-glutamate O-methyltransferase CheR, partial [Leptolyngbyaceae cyanobacterium bins.59]|nr:protein-glutamate O-methyltransferase CheR [Leptolyngbyaceae cyanobacterium bins.59]